MVVLVENPQELHPEVLIFLQTLGTIFRSLDFPGLLWPVHGAAKADENRSGGPTSSL